MHNYTEARVGLILDENRMLRLFTILQQGFFLKVQVGCSLNMLLTGQIGLSPEYIRDMVQTVFMDGKPVDDLCSAIIKDGSRLALSAAMPGLVGAAMRRGGFYNSLRSGITYHETGHDAILKKGLIHMKLFNLLINDLGAVFLKRGIYVPSPDLMDILSRQGKDFWIACKGVFLNDEPITPDLLLSEDSLMPYKLIHLSVKDH